jgi:hypothetical protein
MKAHPFTVQITSRSVTFTQMTTVPGADYLQPVQALTIPLKNWREMVANGGPEIGSVTFCNFTPDQLAAHGAEASPT